MTYFHLHEKWFKAIAAEYNLSSLKIDALRIEAMHMIQKDTGFMTEFNLVKKYWQSINTSFTNLPQMDEATREATDKETNEAKKTSDAPTVRPSTWNSYYKRQAEKKLLEALKDSSRRTIFDMIKEDNEIPPLEGVPADSDLAKLITDALESLPLKPFSKKVLLAYFGLGGMRTIKWLSETNRMTYEELKHKKLSLIVKHEKNPYFLTLMQSDEYASIIDKLCPKVTPEAQIIEAPLDEWKNGDEAPLEATIISWEDTVIEPIAEPVNKEFEAPIIEEIVAPVEEVQDKEKEVEEPIQPIVESPIGEDITHTELPLANTDATKAETTESIYEDVEKKVQAIIAANIDVNELLSKSELSDHKKICIRTFFHKYAETRSNKLWHKMDYMEIVIDAKNKTWLIINRHDFHQYIIEFIDSIDLELLKKPDNIE